MVQKQNTGNFLEARITSDGSTTLYDKILGEHYHSTHGAITESMHVFIRHGLLALKKKSVRILELGFGTGLNALLSWLEAEKSGITLHYTGIDRSSLPQELFAKMNYSALLPQGSADKYRLIQEAGWEEEHCLDPRFTLLKCITDIRGPFPGGHFDLVYFDAFSPEIQPELWEETIFRRLYGSMTQGGILTTYSAKGLVKRRLAAAGFRVESLAGPPGKREMTRAIKSME